MEDAEERVPSRVWSSVSSRISDSPKVISIWWRRAAVGVAAAAVIAAGILVPNWGTAPGTPSSVMIAEVAEDNGSVSPVEAAGDVPSIEEQISSSRLLYADIPSSEKKSSPASSHERVVPSEVSDAILDAVPAAEESEPAVEVSGDAEVKPQATKPASASEAEEDWTDPFAGLGEEDYSTFSDHLSFFAQGNVTSNDKGDASIQRRRSTGTLSDIKTGVQEKSTSTYGVPLSFGIGAKYRFNDKLSIGTGITYSMLSRSFSGTYTEISGGTVKKQVTSDIYNEIHYIGIPLNLYFDILKSNSVQFYVYGGGAVEKGLTNKFRIFSEPDVINYHESVKGLQASAALGMGAEFKITDYLGLYIDPNVHYYFDCKQPNSVRTQKPYMFNLEVGIRFDL